MPPSLLRLASRLGLLAGLLCVPTAFADVEVAHGYVRAVPPGQSISAAYLVLKNTADRPVQLQSAHSKGALTVELHQSMEQDGVMRMRAIKQVEIPPGGEYRLQPGGNHLMLMGLKQPLNAGDSLDINLSFSDGQQLQLLLPVRSPMDASPARTGAATPDGMSHDMHAGMDHAMPHEQGDSMNEEVLEEMGEDSPHGTQHARTDETHHTH